MSDYVKGIPTKSGNKPLFPPDAENGTLWGKEDGEWKPVPIPAGKGAVRYDTYQNLSWQEQVRARFNIGAVSAEDAENYGKPTSVIITGDDPENMQADLPFADIYELTQTGRPVVLEYGAERYPYLIATTPSMLTFSGGLSDALRKRYISLSYGTETAAHAQLSVTELVAGIETLGGVKANPATDTDTTPVRIDRDGYLWADSEAVEQIKSELAEITGNINLLEGIELEAGYLTGNKWAGAGSDGQNAHYNSRTSPYIAVKPGDRYRFIVRATPTAGYTSWMCYMGTSTSPADGTELPLPRVVKTSGNYVNEQIFIIPEGCNYIRVCARLYADGVMELYNISKTGRILPELFAEDEGKHIIATGGAWRSKRRPDGFQRTVRGISHRGYCREAPENTLAAFRLSRKKGFAYVETDVFKTADGIPVLLHDTTVDRTSNGSGNVEEMTFAQLRALDFGSWFSAEFAGEQIPSLEEFLLLCRKLGLHAYVSPRGFGTPEDAQLLHGIAKRCGMARHVTWGVTSATKAGYMKAVDQKARLAVIMGESTMTQQAVDDLAALKTDINEVLVMLDFTAVTDERVQMCMDADVGLELYTINKAAEILAQHPYVSGIFSDTLNAETLMLEDELGQ